MTQYELKEILKLHRMWLDDEEGGKRADLKGADLTNVDLKGADLRGAYLRGADLRGAYLRGADLRGAYLRGAYLRGAYLRGAYLRDADLRCCIGNNQEVKSLQIGTYLISYTKNILNIGCKSHTLDEWKSFTDDEITVMDENALEWWKLNKDIVIELVEREIKG